MASSGMVIWMRRVAVFADYGQFYLQDGEAHSAAMRAGPATDPALEQRRLPGSDLTRTGLQRLRSSRAVEASAERALQL